MNLFEYIGKFHPLAVHLPIGFLTVFIILGLFINRNKLVDAFQIIKLILLASAIFSTATSISGYILSISDSYNLDAVSTHKWFGISMTLLNWIIYFKLKYILNTSVLNYRISLGVVLITMTITGHLGGSLTHGSDFLTPPPPDQWFSLTPKERRKITLNSTAYEATSIIFENNCYVCHGKNKQKGELRLDSKETMLKGGENGKIISARASKSMLIEKLLLPLDHKEHMPPKEKNQLSEAEIGYLTWWIDNGLNFDSTLLELELPDSLLDVLTKDEIIFIDNSIPEKEVKSADEKVLEKLRSFNVVLTPVASNYLSANFMNTLSENSEKAIAELSKIKPQLIWLNLDYQKLGKDSWEKIGQLSNISRLSVKNSNLEDEGLADLQNLKELVHLNLVWTNVTASGLENLKSLDKLESIYLYHTHIENTELESIELLFPNAKIDIGNYIVPTLESDTTVFKLK